MENNLFLINHRIFLNLLLLLIFVFPNRFLSQNKYEKNFYGGIFYLSDYIASEEFESIKENINDLSQVDSIYIKALKFFNGDISETLLCLTFSCLPYNKIRLRFFFNSQLNIPLPSPPKNIFEKRLKNLPQKFFFDSPNNEFGDKDKLSHFFGNAFIKYNSGFFNLSKFMGIFVETVEQELFIDGSYDQRDIITNYLGELFAVTLKEHKNTLPSQILKVYQLLYLRLYL